MGHAPMHSLKLLQVQTVLDCGDFRGRKWRIGCLSIGSPLTEDNYVVIDGNQAEVLTIKSLCDKE